MDVQASGNGGAITTLQVALHYFFSLLAPSYTTYVP
jgi:hypothetical protein